MNLTDINEIRAMLAQNGFRFSKSLGQNFLIAPWVPEDIAASAPIDENTGVLEIGPGVGCLTEQLSKRAGKVLCIELDRALEPVLALTLRECKNVDIIYADALKLDIHALIAERFGGMRAAVCANLPYNVTTPLLTALIEADCFESITVMVQREVARRICAGPGTGDYGAFGVFVQWHMTAEPLFDVPPSCFTPQPKVTSSVVRLTRRAAPPVAVRDEAMLFRVIRAAFNQRRKTLVNALSSAFVNFDKRDLEKTVANCGFNTKIRGEVLDIGGFAKIADEISAMEDADL